MAFQKFTESGRGFKPKVSIRSSGVIGLNSAALKKFELEDVDFVCLLFDPDTNKIAITKASKDDDGAHHLNKGVAGAGISAKRFLDYWDQSVENTQQYECHLDRENGLIVLDRPIRKRERKKMAQEMA
jgi:hypothetical protein